MKFTETEVDFDQIYRDARLLRAEAMADLGRAIARLFRREKRIASAQIG